MKLNFKEIAKNFNELKSSNNYTTEDIKEFLYIVGLPTHNVFIQYCVKDGIIIRIGKNNYTIPKYPMYYGNIENTYNSFRNTLKKYCNKNMELETKIKDAIELLKQNDYLVYKKC